MVHALLRSHSVTVLSTEGLLLPHPVICRRTLLFRPCVQDNGQFENLYCERCPVCQNAVASEP